VTFFVKPPGIDLRTRVAANRQIFFKAHEEAVPLRRLLR
jgi:hypothetical protein